MPLLNAVIDLSHHNTVTSYRDIAAAGIVGVIQKASQGFAYQDPTFAERKQAVQQAGMLFGAYHFGVAGDAVAQAEYFLKAAGGAGLLVLDYEPNPQGHDMSLLEAEEFVHHIFVRTGRYPGLYSGHTVKEALAAANITSPAQTELSKCWLWYARYGALPLVPTVWKNWTLWQYTDGAAGDAPHEVRGVGLCDRDQFNGTEPQLRAFWRDGTSPLA